jgi:hypothetical protein
MMCGECAYDTIRASVWEGQTLGYAFNPGYFVVRERLFSHDLRRFDGKKPISSRRERIGVAP